MKVHALAAAMSIVGIFQIAHAQIGTGFFEWQVSADGGATWRSGAVEVQREQAAVQVRAFVGWSSDAGIAFAGSFLDAVVEGIDGAGGGDVISDLRRPETLLGGTPTNQIAVRRFGNVLKIDDARDTLPPGVGANWLHVRQPFNEFGMSRDNPLWIFQYTLGLDGSLGTRRFSEIFVTLQNGYRDNVNRFFDAYQGSFMVNMPISTRAGASITVVPSPGVAGIVIFGLAWGVRRR